MPTNAQITALIEEGQEHAESLRKLLDIFPANTVIDFVAVFVDGAQDKFEILWQDGQYVVVRLHENGRTQLMAGVIVERPKWAKE